MLRVKCRSSSSFSSSPCRCSTSSPHLSLVSTPDNGLRNGILNMPRRSSSHSISIKNLEETLPDQSSLSQVLEKAPECCSTTYMPSAGTPKPKSTVELTEEIAALEVEVTHLERYLLSLYRRVFEHHLATLPSAVMEQGSRSHLLRKTGSPMQNVIDQSSFHENSDIQSSGRIQHNRPTGGSAGSDHHSYPPPKATSRMDQKNADSGHRSLADHLGASLTDNVPETPDKLSEDIVRCISAIYCKLANPPLPHIGLSVSSISSFSSSSTFSPQYACDSWSPQCNEEAMGSSCQLEGLKEKNEPYASMIEVLKIFVDDDRFKYAAKMLQNFRSLVQRLENVDPRKMKREEKLAFWINIHNALMMHAYLAYENHDNSMKSESLILKAAYNVGGHSINAYEIQSSILACQPCRSASWLQTLFSPRMKIKTGSIRHTYALDYPEPLVHFALCTGAYSDPAVRVYSANNVFQELQVAKKEFIQATVYIHKGMKFMLPKILYYYAKDASLNLSGLLEVVNGCLSETQQKAFQKCIKGRIDKYIEWSPKNSAFRYIIHRDLAKMGLSI